MKRAWERISWGRFRGLPSLVLFRLNHMHNETITVSSRSSWPKCSMKIRYQRRSTKVLCETSVLSKGMPDMLHVSFAFLHSQKKCPLVSSAKFMLRRWSHWLRVCGRDWLWWGGCCDKLSRWKTWLWTKPLNGALEQLVGISIRWFHCGQALIHWKCKLVGTIHCEESLWCVGPY